jgi:transketolase
MITANKHRSTRRRRSRNAGKNEPLRSTFLVLSDYMRPAVRLAALTRIPAICAWTQDRVRL